MQFVYGKLRRQCDDKQFFDLQTCEQSAMPMASSFYVRFDICSSFPFTKLLHNSCSGSAEDQKWQFLQAIIENEAIYVEPLTTKNLQNFLARCQYR
jgi:hypothetical protein